MSETTLIVDGSNIATEGRSSPSLQQLDDAVRALIDDRHFDVVIVVVDATFGHRIETTESDRFEEAALAGEIITPPAGTVGRGDAFILQIADRSDAIVFSNDSFQEFHGTYGWLFDEGRLIGGKPVPPIGWVFVDRVPVRGPTSRRSMKEAGKGAPRKSSAPATSTGGRARGGRSGGASRSDTNGSGSPDAIAELTDAAPTSRSRRKPRNRSDAGKPAPQQQPATSGGTEGSPKKRRRSSSASAAVASETPPRGSTGDAVNDASTFLNFVSHFKIGERVDATITEYSSHGAYAEVEGTRCYIPLKFMADPAPKSAREVVAIGEVRPCVIERFNTPRRGIDLSLADRDSDVDVVNPPSPPTRLIDSSPTNQPAEEAPLAAKKKAPTKKAPARKAPAKKAPAKKAPARKAPARKAPAKKAPARKAPARKAPAKKAPARKAPARKAPAKKAPARKAPARKAPAKKAPARKAPARKAPARRPRQRRPRRRRHPPARPRQRRPRRRRHPPARGSSSAEPRSWEVLPPSDCGTCPMKRTRFGGSSSRHDVGAVATHGGSTIGLHVRSVHLHDAQGQPLLPT